MTEVSNIPKVNNTERTGLIQVFLNRSFLEGAKLWTNEKLLKWRKKKALRELLNAYIGLELAMSFIQLNEVHDIWSSKRFLGNAEIKCVTSCDSFKKISSSLKIYPGYDHAVAVLDPYGIRE